MTESSSTSALKQRVPEPHITCLLKDFLGSYVRKSWQGARKRTCLCWKGGFKVGLSGHAVDLGFRLGEIAEACGAKPGQLRPALSGRSASRCCRRAPTLSWLEMWCSMWSPRHLLGSRLGDAFLDHLGIVTGNIIISCYAKCFSIWRRPIIERWKHKFFIFFQ